MTSAQVGTLLTKWREMGPAEWAERYWVMPDGNPVTLRPIQRVFLDYCFEYSHEAVWLLLSCGKKLGKSFANSVYSAWKFFCYPGLYLLHANSKTQAENLVYEEIRRMIANDGFLSENCHVTARSIVFLPTVSKMLPLAVSGAANAGTSHALLISTEAHGIQSDLERDNWEELQPPPLEIMGVPSQCIADSYSGVLGNSDTWHNMVDHGLEQPLVNEEWGIHFGERVLLLHLEGPEDHQNAWHGSEEQWETWVKDNHRMKSPGKAKSHLYNQRVSGEFGIPDALWLPCFDPDHEPLLPTKSKVITLSIDAASKIKGDDFYLTGWYSEDGLIKLALFKAWKGADRRKEQDFEEVFNYVIWVAENWQVSKLLIDPWQLVSLGQRWQSSGIVVQKVAQSKQQMGLRGSKYLQALRERRVVMYDHPDIRKANQGVKLIDQTEGGVLVKKSGTAKIDFIVSSVMAVSELADFSVPVPPEVLARATIELRQESAWRGRRSWNVGRAGVGSKFRSPDRR